MNSVTSAAGTSSSRKPRHYLHRKVVGYLGASLPVVLVLLNGWRHTPDLNLESISAYYYTGGAAVFAGVLSALAVYLFTYRGNEKKPQEYVHDRVVAVIAGVAASMVALFPTEAPGPSVVLPWWTEAIGKTHYAVAAILFLSFAYMSLVLFTKSGKPYRNAIYRLCGVAMVCCLVWIVLAKTKYPGSIFWPEALALEFFAVSWLVKGQADQDAVAASGWTLGHVRRSGQAIGRALSAAGRR